MTKNNLSIYFEALGLSDDATWEEVKDVYRDLVKVWHPDRFVHDPKLQTKTQEKLKQINDAYDRLRRHYEENGNRPRSKAREQRESKNASKQNRESEPSQDGRKSGDYDDSFASDYSEATQPDSGKGQSVDSVDEQKIFSTLTTEKSIYTTLTHGAIVVCVLLVVVTAAYYVNIGRQPIGSNVNSSSNDSAHSNKGSNSAKSDNPSNSSETTSKTSPQPLPAQGNSAPNAQSNTASLPKEQTQVLTNTSIQEHFTLGSTKKEVLLIQGTPDSFNDTSFSYGYSTVYFINDRISGWNNISKNLKVKLESTSATLASRFTLGTSKDDVIKIQGTPTEFKQNEFSYEYSTIHFKDDKVSGWNNISKNLRVEIKASSKAFTSQFTVGSTKDEVVSIQGTPDRITDNSFDYGYSTVYFQNGRVVRWNNISKNLKVTLASK